MDADFQALLDKVSETYPVTGMEYGTLVLAYRAVKALEEASASLKRIADDIIANNK